MYTGFLRFCRPGLLLASVAFTLSGCASTDGWFQKKNEEGAAPYFLQQQPRACVDTVGIKGRFSVYYKKNDREEGVHGSFEWEQKPDLTTITLLTPLGQVAATVDVMPQLTTFTIPGKQPKTAPDAEGLLRSQLGWDLPVNGMKQWLQGCAVDIKGNPFIATPEKKTVITKEKWQIDYVSWIDGPTMPLPKRINIAKGKDSTNLDINIKLVVDEWRF